MPRTNKPLLFTTTIAEMIDENCKRVYLTMSTKTDHFTAYFQHAK